MVEKYTKTYNYNLKTLFSSNSDFSKSIENAIFKRLNAKKYYCLSKFIKQIINKEHYKFELEKCSSIYKKLYEYKFADLKLIDDDLSITFSSIDQENCFINELLKTSDNFEKSDKDEYNKNRKMELEAEAITYWLFKSCKNEDDRILFIKAIIELSDIVDKYQNISLSKYRNEIYILHYDDIKIEYITSVNTYISLLEKDLNNRGNLYFRGHGNIHYSLKPGIMRDYGWIGNEYNMCNEIIIENPSDFKECNSYLDHLCQMQHYGLPTRLMDITSNPLTALYFSCSEMDKNPGEVILFDINAEKIKYYNSSTSSILSALAFLSDKDKKTLENEKGTPYENAKGKLLSLIRRERGYFTDELTDNILKDVYLVHSKKNNSRITNQSGLFLITGLFNNNPVTLEQYIDSYRLRINNTLSNKNTNKLPIFVIPHSKKADIIKSLDRLSVNQAHVYPEISNVTAYIKSRYQKNK